MKRKASSDEKSMISTKKNVKSQKIEDKMNVLIVGSGGREHVLAWKCSRSKVNDVIKQKSFCVCVCVFFVS